MADTINARGIFWWADAKVPPTNFAPDEAIAGSLTITDDGRITIELDGVLPSPGGQFAIWDEPSPDRKIAGLLKAEHRYLLAVGVHSKGGVWSSNGISYDRFGAQFCLISDVMIPKQPKIRTVEFDLAGYEEWLRLGQVDRTKTSRNLTFKHRIKRKISYWHQTGYVVLERKLVANQHGYFGSRGTDLREIAKFRFTPRKSVGLDEAIRNYGLTHELMILLTGSEYQPDWPTVTLTTRQSCIAYFLKNRSEAKPPEWHESCIEFKDVENILGEIFFNWISLRSDLGPGAYLYLATRRGLHLYQEHKFINLMWGLESLHRTIDGEGKSIEIEDRISRILHDITDETDRKWLSKRTKFIGGTNLEDRLFGLFKSIPLEVDHRRLREFCKLCAKIRNDLSHHGHSNEAVDSGNSIQYLSVRSAIVSHLYHAILLHKIGLSNDVVKEWLTDRRGSSHFEWYLKKAGLKD
ncbi:MAG: hypothetical protein JF588_18995 [Caulobacterales bacterium]|nr:hypothetical protein [Caulobacterales bacterium]